MTPTDLTCDLALHLADRLTTVDRAALASVSLDVSELLRPLTNIQRLALIRELLLVVASSCQREAVALVPPDHPTHLVVPEQAMWMAIGLSMDFYAY